MYASFVWIRVSLWKGTEQKEEEKYGLVRIVSLIRFLHRVAIASLLEETENESRLFFSVQPVTPQSNVNRYSLILQLDEFPPDLYNLKQLQVVADDDDNVLSERTI